MDMRETSLVELLLLLLLLFSPMFGALLLLLVPDGTAVDAYRGGVLSSSCLVVAVGRGAGGDRDRGRFLRRVDRTRCATV